MRPMLTKKVKLVVDGKTAYHDTPKATLGTLVDTLLERGDPQLAWPAEVELR